MPTLEEQLGVDLSSPSQRRAIALEENDASLIRDLIELRRRLGLTQKDIADRLGLSQATIAAFERYDNDPKLSTVRRYAHAVGALVCHSVEEDRSGLATDLWRGNSVERTFKWAPKSVNIHNDWNQQIA